MKKLLLISLLVAGLTVCAFGKDDKENKIIEIVKAKSPLNKNIFMIIDVSASMSSSGKIGKAINFATKIWEQPVDEFNIALIAFNGSTERWPGYTAESDKNPAKKGWAKLPDANATKAAQNWLNKFPGDGGTFPSNSFDIAFKEDVSDMSILFISDGEFASKALMKVIEDGKNYRKEKSLGDISIFVYGIGRSEDYPLMSLMAEESGGAYYSERIDRFELNWHLFK